MAPSRRPKSGTTRYRRNWDTVGLEVLWSRASKRVSDKGADPMVLHMPLVKIVILLLVVLEVVICLFVCFQLRNSDHTRTLLLNAFLKYNITASPDEYSVSQILSNNTGILTQSTFI